MGVHVRTLFLPGLLYLYQPISLRMSKTVTAIIIIVLLSGNIYFFLKSRNISLSPDKVADAASLSAKKEKMAGFKYLPPPFDMEEEMDKVNNNRAELRTYAQQNKCNTNYAFIVDMRIPIYKKRFFVYNLKNDSLLASGLVAHGIGSETFQGELIFSNTPDSRCTSLGKYKIGSSYKGLFGFSYRLQGLDSTNNNSLKRAVVLHGHISVPDEETPSNPICFSYGCPMVSPNFLQKLKGYISKQGKTPILLSIIY